MSVASHQYQTVIFPQCQELFTQLSNFFADFEDQYADVQSLKDGGLDLVFDELNDICEDVLNLLDETLIPNTSGLEPTIFYLKMKGDYFRYLAEFYKGNDNKEVIITSLYLGAKIIYYTVSIGAGLNQCKCFVCDQRRKEGSKPIH